MEQPGTIIIDDSSSEDESLQLPSQNTRRKVKARLPNLFIDVTEEDDDSTSGVTGGMAVIDIGARNASENSSDLNGFLNEANQIVNNFNAQQRGEAQQQQQQDVEMGTPLFQFRQHRDEIDEELRQFRQNYTKELDRRDKKIFELHKEVEMAHEEIAKAAEKIAKLDERDKQILNFIKEKLTPQLERFDKLDASFKQLSQQQEEQSVQLQQLLQPQPQPQPQVQPQPHAQPQPEVNPEPARNQSPPRNERRTALITVSGSFAVQHCELARMIEQAGYRYSPTLTVDCAYLICEPVDQQSQKSRLAAQYGIKIEDAAFLANLLQINIDQII